MTSLLIPSLADRGGERRRPMILLAAATLAGLGLFGLARDFPALLVLSLITGATWAAILPLGEALVLRAARRRELSYGRIRLWGSLTFILGAIGVGRWLEHAGSQVILWSVAGMVACTLIACLVLPEERTRPAGPAGPTSRVWSGNRDCSPSSPPPA